MDSLRESLIDSLDKIQSEHLGIAPAPKVVLPSHLSVRNTDNVWRVSRVGALTSSDLMKMGLYALTHWRETDYTADEFAYRIAEILPTAASLQIPIIFEYGHDKSVELSLPREPQARTKIALDFQPPTDEVYVDVVIEKAINSPILTTIASGTSILTDGTLLHASKSTSLFWKNFFGKVAVSSKLSRSDQLPRRLFNDFCLTQRCKQIKRDIIDSSLFLCTSTAASKPDLRKPLEARIEVVVEESGTQESKIGIQAFVEDQPFFISHLLHSLATQSYPQSHFRLSTKQAREGIAYANRLFLTPRSKEPRELPVSKEELLQSLLAREHSKILTWLNLIEKEWATCDASLHLYCSGEPSRPWHFVRFPMRSLARLLFAWLEWSKQERLYIDGQTVLRIHQSQLVAFLQMTSALCEEVGAGLTLNALPVRSQPASVHVHVTQKPEIDWFELKAEVRCASLKIPPADWIKLAFGGLLLRTGKEVILPSVSDTQAVSHLQTLLENKSRRAKGKTSSTDIPRLEIFDWIALRQKGAIVHLPPEAEQIFQALMQFEGIPHLPLPTKLQATLRDYQHRGFEWLAFLYEHRFGACLADDMGLGKTLQAITLLAWRKSIRAKQSPHLIVVPPSLVFNWHHEIQRFYPSLSVGEYSGSKRDLAKALKHDLVLTTYDCMRRDIEKFAKHTFDLVIFDEAQTLKNITSARTLAALKLPRRFTLCLTGTPMENHVGEYFSIMDLALPGLLGNYKEFCAGTKKGDSRLLARARPFILRRTKGQILKELPPKVESDFYLEMTEEQKEIYTRAVAEVRAEVLAAYKDKTQAQAGIVALAALMRLRQVCISPQLLGKKLQHPAPKISYLTDKMTELHQEGHAALIFSQFTRTLDLLEAQAKELNLPFVRLDGSTPVANRKAIVEKFQKDPRPHTFLISLKAGGVGLNLTRAQYVFHADPWWNPAVENQASDRAHRIGQTRTVFIQRILMSHSIEEKIMQLKKHKQKLFDAIIDNNEGSSHSSPLITRADFEFLLST